MDLLLFPWQLVGHTTSYHHYASSSCCLCLRIGRLASILYHLLQYHSTPDRKKHNDSTNYSINLCFACCLLNLFNLENNSFQVVGVGRGFTPSLHHFLLDIWKPGGSFHMKKCYEKIRRFTVISLLFGKL